ncbi:ubiquitin fusion degradation protein UFD1-domain-containing protein [Microdochium trichocladiopsis]|uniref:Ubiquitin fusion degradation protein UFD1-domain-containing protein n=1 Tax=Microdochium trichocladiopsis TaxID=1682393 RepID=A0A9P9BVF6_9PEZI|nr:ubiquitin fusion degradation protein UFD1-domain-containing protein [Microdochium trichocladiopsis]KAH7040213.1 ubiquitin fusion degradation protein UFD1-domain-containing protein [Microdochium trichocladiopsis]
MYNMARSGGMMRGPAMRRFDEYFRCYPLIMAPGSERPELNYGSKIFLPPSALQKISQLHVQWPLMMELVNGEKERMTHAGVLEFVAEEGRAYIPQWMMQSLQLDVGDMIQIKSTSLELAKMVKLQPQSTNFLEISDPKAVLEKAFRNFATLTRGDVFNFEYNDEVYEVAVLEVKPETEKMGVCMIETDVSVEFAPPVGYVEPQKGSGTSTPRSTRGGGGAGGGLPPGGLLHNQGTMAQSINYDAIKPESSTAAAGARAVSSHFLHEGHKLVSKKGSKAPTPKPSTPVAGSSSNSKVPPAPPKRTTNGPMPLRLPPNKIFFGYDIKPVKTDADKQAEKENAERPHFAGQGQTLRGGTKKKGVETPEDGGGSSSKGNDKKSTTDSGGGGSTGSRRRKEEGMAR